MTDSLRDLVIETLRRTRRLMPTSRIAQECGVRSALPVTQILRTLAQEGLVATPRAGAWKWIGPLEARTPTPPPTRRRQTGTTEPPPIDAPVVGKRWHTFRSLCRYYAECVRLEERTRLAVYADKQNQEFLQLTRGIDWAGLSSGRPSRLVLDDEQLVFVRRGLGLKRHPRWFVGGPVDHYSSVDNNTGDRWTSLQPIFVIQVLPTLEGRDLHLNPTGHVEINHGWLQKRFRDADQRNEFLAAVGLLEGFETGARDVGEDEDGDELPPLPVADFRDAYRSLFLGYRDWWRESGNLGSLSQTPPLHELERNGLYNRALLIVGPSLKFGRRLVEELYEIADSRSDEELDATALAHLFPHEAPPARSEGNGGSDEAGAQQPLSEYAHLNDEQREAVERALVAPLTVLTGPPGTGKSVVVAHAMLNLALAGQSALFASRNHQALEAVEPRLNALVEPEMLVMRPSRPFGADAAQKQWQQALVELLAKPRPADAAEQLQAARQRLQRAVTTRHAIEAQAARRLDLQERLAEAEQALHKLQATLPPAQQQLVRTPEEGLPDASLLLSASEALARALERQRQPGLWPRLRRLLGDLLRVGRQHTVEAASTRARELLQPLIALGSDDLRGASTDDDAPDLLAALRAWQPFVEARSRAHQCDALRPEIELLPDHVQTTDELRKQQDLLQTFTLETARAFASAVGSNLSPEERQRFAELRAGQENHQGSATEGAFQKAFAKALPELLRHFPLWATSNLSAHRASPLQPGAFDLLIIDEASQCDIASVVPLLFRAKRAMAVGDPMQLRHISQLPKAADLQLRRQHGLVDASARLERFSIGANSFYDLASSSKEIDAPLGLRAHYRCHPEIAAFCNQAFYNGQLRVMTDRHRLRRVPGASDELRGIEWTDVRGPITSASSGCHSEALTEAVVVELERLAAADFDGTVGVVTPFRVQADRIRDQAHARLPAATIAQWQLLVHTVDGFQGDERDVVLFALTGGPDMPPGSRGFLASTPNRCNVAVSRARSFLRVLGHRDWAATCGIGFVQAMHKACANAESRGSATRWDLVGPVWEPLLAQAMREAGLEFVQQYLTCGFYLDFALISGNRRIDVEVDGETYHRAGHGGRRTDDLYRDFTLRAAGWEVLRFWVYELREDLAGCVEKIRQTFGKRLAQPHAPRRTDR
jgi:very-short-patch-repair endonuclease